MFKNGTIMQAVRVGRDRHEQCLYLAKEAYPTTFWGVDTDNEVHMFELDGAIVDFPALNIDPEYRGYQRQQDR